MRSASITEQVIGSAFEVHKELGAGFLEKVYVNALQVALRDRGVHAEQQVGLDVLFRGRGVGKNRADVVFGSSCVVEVKAQSELTGVDEAQLLNYLKASGIDVGLLINFGRSVEYRRRVM